VLDLDADRPALIVKTTINNEPVVFVSIHLMAYGLRWVDPTDIPKAIVEKTKNQNAQVKYCWQSLITPPGLSLSAATAIAWKHRVHTERAPSPIAILPASWDGDHSQTGSSVRIRIRIFSALTTSGIVGRLCRWAHTRFRTALARIIGCYGFVSHSAT
jgi:hypothetical protein